MLNDKKIEYIQVIHDTVEYLLSESKRNKEQYKIEHITLNRDELKELLECLKFVLNNKQMRITESMNVAKVLNKLK